MNSADSDRSEAAAEGATRPASGMALLQAAEADGQIFEPQIEGFALWPLMRLNAWQVISQVRIGSLHPKLWRRLLKYPVVLTMPAYAAYATWQRQTVKRRHCNLLIHSSGAYRTVRRDDGHWNVYFDDIANHPALRDGVLRVEARTRPISPWRVSAPRHLFTDAFMLDMTLGALVVADNEAVRQAERTLDIFSERMRSAGRPLDSAQHATLRVFILQSARRFRRGLHWYRRLLADCAPKAIALTSAYSYPAIVAAARERGIPVVEFQHGLIHHEHPGYMWLPQTRAQRTHLAIPDFIFTYGAYWSDLLTRSGFWLPAEVPAVGSVRMDWLRRQPAEPTSAPGVLDLVFTTQFATRGWTIPLITEFLERAGAAGLALRLTVKVHRGEHQYIGEYRKLGRQFANVRVMSAYEGDTLALIAAADAHLSGWSTCHFEAIGLGTPTVVLEADGPDAVRDLDQFSNVYRAQTADQIVAAVRQAATDRGAATAALDRESEKLFRPGALERAVSLLQQVADGKACRGPAHAAAS